MAEHTKSCCKLWSIITLLQEKKQKSWHLLYTYLKDFSWILNILFQKSNNIFLCVTISMFYSEHENILRKNFSDLSSWNLTFVTSSHLLTQGFDLSVEANSWNKCPTKMFLQFLPSFFNFWVFICFCLAVVNGNTEKKECQKNHVTIQTGDMIVDIIAVRSIWSSDCFPEQTSLISLRSESPGKWSFLISCANDVKIKPNSPTS